MSMPECLSVIEQYQYGIANIVLSGNSIGNRRGFLSIADSLSLEDKEAVFSMLNRVELNYEQIARSAKYGKVYVVWW